MTASGCMVSRHRHDRFARPITVAVRRSRVVLQFACLQASDRRLACGYPLADVLPVAIGRTFEQRHPSDCGHAFAWLHHLLSERGEALSPPLSGVGTALGRDRVSEQEPMAARLPSYHVSEPRHHGLTGYSHTHIPASPCTYRTARGTRSARIPDFCFVLRTGVQSSCMEEYPPTDRRRFFPLTHQSAKKHSLTHRTVNDGSCGFAANFGLRSPQHRSNSSPVRASDSATATHQASKSRPRCSLSSFCAAPTARASSPSSCVAHRLPGGASINSRLLRFLLSSSYGNCGCRWNERAIRDRISPWNGSRYQTRRATAAGSNSSARAASLASLSGSICHPACVAARNGGRSTASLSTSPSIRSRITARSADVSRYPRAKSASRERLITGHGLIGQVSTSACRLAVLLVNADPDAVKGACVSTACVARHSFEIARRTLALDVRHVGDFSEPVDGVTRDRVWTARAILAAA